MTNVITTTQDMRTVRQALNGTIGFVPTLGALHGGHQSLIQQSLANNDITVLSLFVNPTQFNQVQDLAAYPADTKADIDLAKALGVDYVFMPDRSDMYPDNYQYQIHETSLSQLMEGQQRPGHFIGMLTIVMKLLNLIRPDKAYFGEKDHQQLELVRGMVKAFFLDCDIIACPTIRTGSLPLSSRNIRLSTHELEQAKRALHDFHRADTLSQAHDKLAQQGITVEYLAEHQQRRYIAININGTRIIDNYAIGGTHE